MVSIARLLFHHSADNKGKNNGGNNNKYNTHLNNITLHWVVFRRRSFDNFFGFSHIKK